MTLDKKTWGLIALGILLLACLGIWGSRERTWSKQVDELTRDKTTLSDTLAIQKTQNQQLREENDTTEVVEPVELPGGKIAYVTHRTSKTVDTAMLQAAEQVDQLNTEVVSLKAKLSTKETETVKSAPFWNVVVGWEFLNAKYYAGGGINLGGLSVSVENPVAWSLQPQLVGMIRF